MKSASFDTSPGWAQPGELNCRVFTHRSHTATLPTLWECQRSREPRRGTRHWRGWVALLTAGARGARGSLAGRALRGLDVGHRMPLRAPLTEGSRHGQGHPAPSEGGCGQVSMQVSICTSKHRYLFEPRSSAGIYAGIYLNLEAVHVSMQVSICTSKQCMYLHTYCAAQPDQASISCSRDRRLATRAQVETCRSVPAVVVRLIS